MIRKKNITGYLLGTILCSLFLLSGCLSEKMDTHNAMILIEVVPPLKQDFNMENITVRLQHTQQPVSYTAVTDKNGIARFEVEYGFYQAQAQYKYQLGYKTLYINASSSSFVVNSRKEQFIKMNSVYPKSEQLVFKEIYYSSCKGATGSNYLRDQYVIIYNNSPETAYLDSVCIGFLDPMNAPSSPKGWEGLPYLPVFNFAWMFPGTGTDYPLQPGEEVVVSVNGINHVALGNTNSVDLSKPGYWAMYDIKANLTNQSVPAPGVSCMQNIWKYVGSSCSFSSVSPAWVMWKIKDIPFDEFLDTYIRKHPVNNSNTRYLTIPVEWIYDGVECFLKPGYVKRLPPSVDNGYSVLQEGAGSGMSVHRVIDERLSTPKRTVYLDSNDSSQDFIKQKPSLKE
ncbi:MAG: DUF4876 domain-containing protein [Bacteroidales bacterium]